MCCRGDISFCWVFQSLATGYSLDFDGSSSQWRATVATALEEWSINRRYSFLSKHIHAPSALGFEPTILAHEHLRLRPGGHTDQYCMVDAATLYSIWVWCIHCWKEYNGLRYADLNLLSDEHRTLFMAHLVVRIYWTPLAVICGSTTSLYAVRIRRWDHDYCRNLVKNFTSALGGNPHSVCSLYGRRVKIVRERSKLYSGQQIASENGCQ
jgi:hypothetical protein